MILPFAVLVNSMAASIDISHPVSWLNGTDTEVIKSIIIWLVFVANITCSDWLIVTEL